MIAVAYLRVSKDDQHLGPDAQRAAIEQWAASSGASVLSWHVDQGQSGGKEIEDRPALGEAIETLRASNANVLVVAKRDRLARDVYVAATIERVVARLGASVVSADGSGNGTSPADGFMRNILDAAAAYERDLIRSRTRAALAVKRRRGERVGTIPYGFACASGRLEPHAGEQATIARARELRRAGLSLRTLARTLAVEGVRSRLGGRLGLSQVAKLVRPCE